MGGVEESGAVREGEVDAGGGREDKRAGHLKSSMKRLPDACPSSEEQKSWKFVESDALKLLENCTGDLLKTSKMTMLNLRRFEQNNGL